MDTAQWPQEIVVKPIEEIVTNTTCPIKAASSANSAALEIRKTRPQKEAAALNCPRCNSTNTKFCYYNNYSLTQPRYFCKTCRRYWTEGGSLRNIPVGGGSRKNKRSAPSSSSKKIPDLVTPQNPNNGGQDLNLSFPSAGLEMNDENNKQIPASALELITGISSSSRGLNSFIPNMPVIPDPNNNTGYTTASSTGFPMQDLFIKPATLNFSLDGLGLGLGSSGTGYGRLLFPFEDLKQQQVSTDIHHELQNKDQGGDSAGYWTGMLGGGSW